MVRLLVILCASLGAVWGSEDWNGATKVVLPRIGPPVPPSYVRPTHVLFFHIQTMLRDIGDHALNWIVLDAVLFLCSTTGHHFVGEKLRVTGHKRAVAQDYIHFQFPWENTLSVDDYEAWVLLTVKESEDSPSRQFLYREPERHRFVTGSIRLLTESCVHPVGARTRYMIRLHCQVDAGGEVAVYLHKRANSLTGGWDSLDRLDRLAPCLHTLKSSPNQLEYFLETDWGSVPLELLDAPGSTYFLALYLIRKDGERHWYQPMGFSLGFVLVEPLVVSRLPPTHCYEKMMVAGKKYAERWEHLNLPWVVFPTSDSVVPITALLTVRTTEKPPRDIDRAQLFLPRSDGHDQLVTSMSVLRTSEVLQMEIPPSVATGRYYLVLPTSDVRRPPIRTPIFHLTAFHLRSPMDGKDVALHRPFPLVMVPQQTVAIGDLEVELGIGNAQCDDRITQGTPSYVAIGKARVALENSRGPTVALERGCQVPLLVTLDTVPREFLGTFNMFIRIRGLLKDPETAESTWHVLAITGPFLVYDSSQPETRIVPNARSVRLLSPNHGLLAPQALHAKGPHGPQTRTWSVRSTPDAFAVSGELSRARLTARIYQPPRGPSVSKSHE